MTSRRRSLTSVVPAALALSGLACSLCTLGGGRALPLLPLPDGSPLPADSPEAGGTPVPPVTTPAPQSAYTTLEALNQTVVPARDRLDLAVRLAGLSPDEISPPQPKTYNLGDVEVFWADNSDTDEVFQVAAVLRYMTPHVYMWVEEGINYDQRALAEAAERFETQTYPINRRYFGSEWSPGIDGDVRLHVLHTSVIGDSVAGYFSSQSQYPAAAVPYSNEREMFFINIANIRPGDSAYDGVLAHEFQHMIHWNVDFNEDSWVNEGLSELAVLLNGLDTSGFEYYFVTNPDLQLTDWPEDGARGAHYGAAFLFHAYFLDRFGEEALRALVRNPHNGMEGVEDTLRQLDITDPATGQPVTAGDLFADWVIANLANDPAVGDGRYAYSLLPTLLPASTQRAAKRLPVEGAGSVHQFGTDYIQLPPASRLLITFDGSQQVRVLPTETRDTDGDPDTDDRFVWWSNRGDESDTTLTTRLDLRGVSSATLEYDVWYLIEENWDYAYLMVSEDGGQTWAILETPHTSTLDPHGTGYGPGYTGSSADQPGADEKGWLHEEIDLSGYAGREIELRFEVITDDAVNRPGLLVDNVRVEAIGFYDDAEQESELWQARGFVRHDNVLPQAYVVQVLALGEKFTLKRMQLDADNHGQLLFEPGPGAEEVVLVVSGLTPYTNEVTGYTYSVEAQ